MDPRTTDRYADISRCAAKQFETMLVRERVEAKRLEQLCSDLGAQLETSERAALKLADECRQLSVLRLWSFGGWFLWVLTLILWRWHEPLAALFSGGGLWR